MTIAGEATADQTLTASNDTTDADGLGAIVADYGVDQQNDGRLFEISLGSDWFVA